MKRIITIAMALVTGALALASGCAYRGQAIAIHAETVTITIDQTQEGGGSLSAEGSMVPK